MFAEVNASIKEFKPKIDPSDYEGEEGSYDVCIANISPKERRKRLNYGISQFIFGFVVLAVLFAVGADKAWRLPLFIVFASGAVSCFQSFDKTWVALAARGSRKFGEKSEKIENQDEVRQIRRQALKVIGKGVAVALGITLIIMFIP